MTEHVQYNLRNGETVPTVIILLETEFPRMRNQVRKDWIEEVGRGRVG